MVVEKNIVCLRGSDGEGRGANGQARPRNIPFDTGWMNLSQSVNKTKRVTQETKPKKHWRP